MNVQDCIDYLSEQEQRCMENAEYLGMESRDTDRGFRIVQQYTSARAFRAARLDLDILLKEHGEDVADDKASK